MLHLTTCKMQHVTDVLMYINLRDLNKKKKQTSVKLGCVCGEDVV